MTSPCGSATDTSTGIRVHPCDRSIQKLMIDGQVRAYKALRKYKAVGVPAGVLKRIGGRP